MNAPTHALLGAVSWLTLAGPVEHRPGWQQAAGTLLAVVVSVGPDIDNARWWRKLDRYIPDEWVGFGGPLGHRGLTHWWGWPALLAWTAWQIPAEGRWPILALAVGWASHLVGDLVFGITPPGIPLAPWWAHIGLRLKVGSRKRHPFLNVRRAWTLSPLTPIFTGPKACWHSPIYRRPMSISNSPATTTPSRSEPTHKSTQSYGPSTGELAAVR